MQGALYDITGKDARRQRSPTGILSHFLLPDLSMHGLPV